MVTGSLPFDAADGKDASLFRLIARGVYTWPAPRPAADGAVPPNPPRRVGISVECRLANSVPPIGTCSRSSDIESIVSQLLRHGLPGREASTPTMASAAQLRLGSGIGDMCDVQAHPWWEGLDWLALEAGRSLGPYTAACCKEGLSRSRRVGWPLATAIYPAARVRRRRLQFWTS